MTTVAPTESQGGALGSGALVPPPKRSVSEWSASDLPSGDDIDSTVSESLETSTTSTKLAKRTQRFTKRQKRVQRGWFLLGGFLAGIFAAFNILVPLYITDRHGLSDTLAAAAAGVLRLGTLARIPTGMLSDKFNWFGLGYRRPWLSFSLVVGGVFLAFMAVVESVDFSYAAFVVLLLLLNCCVETWDNILDGYAVDVTPKEEAGLVQGVLVNGSRGFGLMLGFFVLARVSEMGDNGWLLVIVVCCILSIAPAPLAFALPEPAERSVFNWNALRELKRRQTVAHCFYAFWGGAIINSSITAVPLYLEDIGATNSQVGDVLTSISAMFVVGAIVFGYALDKWRRHIAWVFLAAIASAALSGVCFLLHITVGDMSLDNMGFIWMYSIVGGIAGGASTSTNTSLVLLEVTDEAVSASFYAVFATFTAMGFGFGASITGVFIDAFGYITMALILIIALVPQIPALYVMLQGTDYAKKETAVEDVSGDIEFKVVNTTDDEEDAANKATDCSQSDASSIAAQGSPSTERTLSTTTPYASGSGTTVDRSSSSTQDTVPSRITVSDIKCAEQDETSFHAVASESNDTQGDIESTSASDTPPVSADAHHSSLTSGDANSSEVV